MKVSANILIGLAIAACSSAMAQTLPLQNIRKFDTLPAPEPGTIALLGVALVGGGAVAAWKRRSKRQGS